MAGSSNPFTGLASGQKDRGGSTQGHGHGTSHSRSGPSQIRNAGSTRETRPRGRGRGVGAAAKSGRGRGNTITGSGDSHPSHGMSGATTGNPSSSSLFAHVKQTKPFSPFGQSSGSSLQSNAASPFADIRQGSSTFGPPSNMDGAVGSSINHSRDPRRRPTAMSKAARPKTYVPVEDAKVISSYHDRYERLKHDRAKQRERAIKEGQMADPNQPTSLNQAITPVGTCTSMCPEFERVERIVQKMVDKSEKLLYPSTNSLQNMETKMLKRFRRSAAGYDEQLPSDIRTPKTLLQTTNYLIRHILGGNEPLGLIHKFVWDRTRSIRNDFSVQQLTQGDHVKMAVTCLERIARFHIVSLHLLSSPANQEPFDHHQEREQLNNTMLSLMYYYDDNRGHIQFPHEDEFRAYYIIFSIHDQRPDLEARVQKWPAELRESPRVQLALELFAAASNTWEYQGTLDAKRPNAIAQGFYTRFFSLIDSPSVPYLMACVAEIYFNHVRQTAIRSIWKAYCRQPQSQQHKNEEWTIDELTEVLHFDNDTQTLNFCEEQGLEFAENSDGQLYLNWGSRPIDSAAFQPSSQHSFSEKHVESKRAGRTLVAVVLGLNIEQAAKHGVIDRSLLTSRPESQLATVSTSAEEDNALFVSEDENEKQSPKLQINGITPEEGSSAESSASTSSLNPFESLQEATTQELQTDMSSLPSTESRQAFSSWFTSSQTQGVTTTLSAASNPFAASPAAATTFSPQISANSQNQNAAVSSSTQEISSVFQPKPTFSSLFEPKKDSTTTPTSPFQTKPSNITSFSPTTSVQQFPTAAASSAFSITSFPAPAGQEPVSTHSGKAKSTPSNPRPRSIFDTSNRNLPFAESKLEDQSTVFSQPAHEQETFKAFPQTFVPNGSSLFEAADAFRSSAGHDLSPQPSTYIQRISPNQPTGSTTFSGTPPITSQFNSSLFSNSAPETASSTTEKGIVPEHGISENASAHKKAAISTAEKSPSLLFPGKTPQHLVKETVKETAKEPVTEAADQPFAVMSSPVEPPLSTESLVQPANEELPSEYVHDERERHRLAWIEILNETANRRRQEFSSSRKRALEEQEQRMSFESASKAAKISRAEEAPPRPSSKPSLALASIAPLPTLPILEEVRSMTQRKPAPKPEPKGPVIPHIDEDELLLSAARIAAESLKNGPSLLENLPSDPDPFRASQNLSRSVSSRGLSRSQSPLQSRVNGYEVALAPDTPLGLGRTMSRTEQRIRLTGGKGLAFKPLNFTPERKIPAKKRKKDKR